MRFEFKIYRYWAPKNDYNQRFIRRNTMMSIKDIIGTARFDFAKIVPTCFAYRDSCLSPYFIFANIQIVSFFVAGIFVYLLVFNAGILKCIGNKFFIVSSERAWKNKPIGRLLLYSISSYTQKCCRNQNNSEGDTSVKGYASSIHSRCHRTNQENLK
jgi:hypothetical protein